MNLYTFNQYGRYLKENQNSDDEENGKILLNYDNKTPSSWYYIDDAIENGLLESSLGIDDEIAEVFCSEKYNEDFCNLADLKDKLIYDFEDVLGELLTYLMDNNIIDEMSKEVAIEGVDEEGEYWSFSYEND